METVFNFYNTIVMVIISLLLIINIILAPFNPYGDKNNPFECGYLSFIWQNRVQFSISFFIIALLFLLFDLEVLLVYPYFVSTHLNDIYGLISMVIFLLVLVIGFGFEIGKKALRITSKQLELVFISIEEANKNSFVNRTNSGWIRIFSFICSAANILRLKVLYKIYILSLLPTNPDRDNRVNNNQAFPDGTRLADVPRDADHSYIEHVNVNPRNADGDMHAVQAVEYQDTLESARLAYNNNVQTITSTSEAVQYTQELADTATGRDRSTFLATRDMIAQTRDAALQANERGQDRWGPEVLNAASNSTAIQDNAVPADNTGGDSDRNINSLMTTTSNPFEGLLDTIQYIYNIILHHPVIFLASMTLFIFIICFTNNAIKGNKYKIYFVNFIRYCNIKYWAILSIIHAALQKNNIIHLWLAGSEQNSKASSDNGDYIKNVKDQDNLANAKTAYFENEVIISGTDAGIASGIKGLKSATSYKDKMGYRSFLDHCTASRRAAQQANRDGVEKWGTEVSAPSDAIFKHPDLASALSTNQSNTASSNTESVSIGQSNITALANSNSSAGEASSSTGATNVTHNLVGNNKISLNMDIDFLLNSVQHLYTTILDYPMLFIVCFTLLWLMLFKFTSNLTSRYFILYNVKYYVNNIYKYGKLILAVPAFCIYTALSITTIIISIYILITKINYIFSYISVVFSSPDFMMKNVLILFTILLLVCFVFLKYKSKLSLYIVQYKMFITRIFSRILKLLKFIYLVIFLKKKAFILHMDNPVTQTGRDEASRQERPSTPDLFSSSPENYPDGIYPDGTKYSEVRHTGVNGRNREYLDDLNARFTTMDGDVVGAKVVEYQEDVSRGRDAYEYNEKVIEKFEEAVDECFRSWGNGEPTGRQYEEAKTVAKAADEANSFGLYKWDDVGITNFEIKEHEIKEAKARNDSSINKDNLSNNPDGDNIGNTGNGVNSGNSGNTGGGGTFSLLDTNTTFKSHLSVNSLDNCIDYLSYYAMQYFDYLIINYGAFICLAVSQLALVIIIINYSMLIAYYFNIIKKTINSFINNIDVKYYLRIFYFIPKLVTVILSNAILPTLLFLIITIFLYACLTSTLAVSTFFLKDLILSVTDYIDIIHYTYRFDPYIEYTRVCLIYNSEMDNNINSADAQYKSTFTIDWCKPRPKPGGPPYPPAPPPSPT